MQVRLLGPVEVVEGGRPIPIRAAKQRALLAVLALHAERVTTLETLVDCLWDDPPASAEHAVAVYVSSLRKTLPGEHRLVRRGPGYLLDLPRDEIDALRFETLVRDAKRALTESDAAGASTLLRDALALWRGPALVDALEGALRLEAQRLDELRVEAQVACLDAELRLDRVAAVSDELEQLVVDRPLHEGVVRLAMIARYRAGRQADALELYRRYRTRLDEELGLEPGGEIRALEAALIRHELPEDTAPRPAPAARTTAGLIGRERELEAVTGLVRSHRGRIVTLTGPGGIGKTTLALAVAERVGDAFPRGAVVAALAELQDAQLVLPTIAGLVGAAPSADDLVSAIAGRLDASPALVVLDNAEHLRDAWPALGTLAARCAGSAFLATSRGPLQAPDEVVVPVEPLAVPAERESPEGCLNSPSVIVLVDGAARRNVSLGIEDAGALAAIARRLDGLPLALELAAGRIGLLGAEGVLARLDRALDVLAGDETKPSRQRTLRLAIEWSDRLLGAVERSLLATLACFAGGAPVAAIEQVSQETEASVLDAIQALLDVGLARQELSRSTNEPRVMLSEPVRAYALERLAETGREEDVRARHAVWIDELAAAARPEFAGPNQAHWLAVVDDELANVRAALTWSSGRRPDLVATTISNLYAYWFARGLLREARDAVAETLTARDRLDPSVWAHAASRAAWFETELGDLDGAEQLATESAAVFRAAGDSTGLQRSLSALATVASARGDWETAARFNREVLDDARKVGEPHALAFALINTASDAERAGDWRSVRGLLEEALALLVRLEDDRGISITQTNLAACLLMDGDDADAVALCEAALKRSRRLGLRVVEPYAVAITAHASLETDPGRAGELALDAARDAAEQGLTDALCSAGLARAAALAGCGDGAVGARVFAAVSGIAGDAEIVLPPWFSQRAERIVRANVDDHGWRRAQAEARALTPSEAEALICARPGEL